MARKDNDKAAIVLVPMAICGALALTQHHIENWKAVQANIDKAFIVAPNTYELRHPVELAFLTAPLHDAAPVIEPLAGSAVSNAVAVQVQHQRYERSGSGRRRSNSWNTKDISFNFSHTPRLGNFRLVTNLMEKNGGEVWQHFDAGQLATSTFFSQRPGWHIYNGTVYAQRNHGSARLGDERYRYSIIPMSQSVTAVAQANPATGGYPLLTPTPLMPEGYPGLWYGEVSPNDFKSALWSRFINTMAGIGGVVLLVGWFGMIMLNAIFGRQRKISGALCGAGAAGASLLSMAFWYVVPTWYIAAPMSVVLLFLTYVALRATQSTRSDYNAT